MAAALVLTGCNKTPPNETTIVNTTVQPTPGGPGAPPAASAPADTTAADAADAPKRQPPPGTGNAIGRVLFDGKGAAGIEVMLCEDMNFLGGCSGKTYPAKTDAKGYYVIDKVKPGDYALAVRVFDTNSYIYPTSGILSAAKYKIEKDASLPVRTVNLWKTNLQVESPKNGDTIKTGKPKLAWKAYPNAANYKVTLRTKAGTGDTVTLETSSNSATPDKALLNGDYEWKVEATNADGTKIAETAKDAAFKVVGQAASNTVELLTPKPGSTIAGAGVTLTWKAHPQADEYKVYLKGNIAKDPVLSFQSVTGTSYKLPSALPPDQYFWSVDAYKSGEKLAGATLTNFTVK